MRIVWEQGDAVWFMPPNGWDVPAIVAKGNDDGEVVTVVITQQQGKYFPKGLSLKVETAQIKSRTQRKV